MKAQFFNRLWIASIAVLPFLTTHAVADNSSSFVSGRMHQVSLDEAGSLTGRIAAIEQSSNSVIGSADMKVFFLSNGEVVKQATTDRNGNFSVEGLAAGSYSFIATGEKGLVAYGIRVVAEGDAEANIIEAATISVKSDVAKTVLQARLPRKVADEILKGNQNDGHPVAGTNRVRLNDGTLSGRVTPLVGSVEIAEGTTIHLIKDGIEVAQLVADENGLFSVDSMDAGVYEFIATGDVGFAAVSFVAYEANADQADSDAVAVALPLGPDSDMLEVGLAGQEDLMFVQDSLDFGGGSSFIQGGDVGGGFVSGGAMGGACGACGDCGGGLNRGGGFLGRGGGGFGGGGGLGRLLLLGGLAGGVVAISTSGSDDPDPASPVQVN